MAPKKPTRPLRPRPANDDTNARRGTGAKAQQQQRATAGMQYLMSRKAQSDSADARRNIQQKAKAEQPSRNEDRAETSRKVSAGIAAAVTRVKAAADQPPSDRRNSVMSQTASALQREGQRARTEMAARAKQKSGGGSSDRSAAAKKGWATRRSQGSAKQAKGE